MPLLTTITPYWGRTKQLGHWLRALEIATTPRCYHLLYVVGEEPVPAHSLSNLKVIRVHEMPKSIGHYHNLGAAAAPSPWIMKLDVDAIANPLYFQQLENVLHTAGPRQWFNGGMLMLNERATSCLSAITVDVYQHVMANRLSYVQGSNVMPVASNFICRRDSYLSLGGCDSRFEGYGWEDYQQIYMLERHQLGKDPLPGPLGMDNVTTRCREEISRRKTKELLLLAPWLCLFHRWHPSDQDPLYRGHMQRNKKVLLDYITTSRQHDSQ